MRVTTCAGWLHSVSILHLSLFCIIKLDNPGPGLSKTYKSPTHESFPSLQGGLSVPRRRVFCSHLLHCTCNHSGGKLREAKRWNWITEGTQQCGKRKWGEIRCLDGQGERVKRDKHRQRDRKSEGGPTPQSQRIDVKEGINSWIQLLSMSLVTAAREWLSLWRLWTVFFLPFSALTPLHRNLKQCCLTCSRQSNEISCPRREPYKPLFLPSQMWTGNPCSRLLSFRKFASQPRICVAASQLLLTLYSPTLG